MKRRSGLPILLRLARLRENRALRSLGQARARIEAAQDSLRTLEAKLESTQMGAVLLPGTKLDAGLLAVHAECATGLAFGSAALKQGLAAAHEEEESARTQVIQARLRLRTLRSAAAKREARERLLMRRAEVRRLDEAGRGMRSDGES